MDYNKIRQTALKPPNWYKQKKEEEKQFKNCCSSSSISISQKLLLQ